MAKWATDAMMDAALDYVRSKADKMIVCSAQPTTYTEAVTTFALADVTMTENTDFTKSDGDTGGRKFRVAAKNAVTIDASGTATHIALVDTASSGELLYVTTCTSQALTAGGTVDIPVWDVEIYDPA